MSDAFVQLLMNEHGAALEDKGAFQSDMEYMRLNELKYTLKRYDHALYVTLVVVLRSTVLIVIVLCSCTSL